METNRTFRSLLYVAAALMLWSGCIREEGSSGNGGDKAIVSFAAPVIADDAAPASASAQSTDTRAALAENTTVRVVAYLAGSTTYSAEQAYYMNGGKLKPCTVKSDGSFDAPDNENELALVPDKYDFYAITPALPLNADKKTVNVSNGADYAASLTANVNVTADQTLNLTQLARKCAKIALVVKKSDDNTEMSELKLNPSGAGVTISALPATAANVAFNADIPAAAGTSTLTVPASAFSLSGTTSTAITYLLPRLGTDRINISYDLSYTVSGTSESKTLNGSMGNTVLEKGKSYTFTLTMRKTGATLSVKEWIDGGIQDVIMGVIDYTDNGKGLFLMAPNDAYNPSDITTTIMNWYVGTGTVDAINNANSLSACPEGWIAASKQDLHLAWIYKGAMPYNGKLSGHYWALDASLSDLSAAWFSEQDYGRSFGLRKSEPYRIRCVLKRTTTDKKYPYVEFNTDGRKSIIVSRDAEGGVRTAALLTEAETAYLNTKSASAYNELSEYNKVSPRFEVAQTNASTNATWSEWMKGTGTGNDGSACPSGWRMPTQREMMLIMNMALRNEITTTDKIVISNNSYYMSGAESSANTSNMWSMSTTLCHVDNKTSKTTTSTYVRCVRDINVEQPKPIIIGQFGGWNGTEYTAQLQLDWGSATDDDAHGKKWSLAETVTGATDIYYGFTNINTLKKLSPDLSDYPAAKYCADKGNGWYLPSYNQLMAVWVFYDAIPSGFRFHPNYYWASSETGIRCHYVSFTAGSTDISGGKIDGAGRVRCVRNVTPSGKNAPKVVADAGRMIIDSRDMTAGAVTSTKKANTTNVTDNRTLGATDLTNIGSEESNKKVYSYFEISKDDNSASADWLNAVNTCANLADDGNGKWRLPTQRELQLIWIMYKNIDTNKNAVSGFVLPTEVYWSATEKSDVAGWYFNFTNGKTISQAKGITGKVRCIRDL